MPGCEEGQYDLTTLQRLHVSRQICTQGAVHLHVCINGMVWLGLKVLRPTRRHRSKANRLIEQCWFVHGGGGVLTSIANKTEYPVCWTRPAPSMRAAIVGTRWRATGRLAWVVNSMIWLEKAVFGSVSAVDG